LFGVNVASQRRNSELRASPRQLQTSPGQLQMLPGQLQTSPGQLQGYVRAKSM
jgi:hypothetical protein